MDPISSVAAIYATSKLTASARENVRICIVVLTVSSPVLDELDSMLGDYLKDLPWLAIVFQNHAGTLGKNMLAQTSVIMQELAANMETINKVLTHESGTADISNSKGLLLPEELLLKSKNLIATLKDLKFHFGSWIEQSRPRGNEVIVTHPLNLTFYRTQADRIDRHESSANQKEMEQFTRRLKLREKLAFRNFVFTADEVIALTLAYPLVCSNASAKDSLLLANCCRLLTRLITMRGDESCHRLRHIPASTLPSSVTLPKSLGKKRLPILFSD